MRPAQGAKIRMSKQLKAIAILLLLHMALCGAATRALAQDRKEAAPEALRGVGVTEKLDARVPMDMPFTDQDGKRATLGQYLGKGRPVILLLGYLECPMLCTLVLNGLTEAIQGINWAPGKQFDIVFVSIDPAETPTLARLKKQAYVKEYGKPESEAGWHFLTGNKNSIAVLADAVGFGYAYDRTREQYAHPAVLMFLTPDGRMSRYLAGIKYEPRDVKLALFEAADGKIGTRAEQVYLSCYHYDAAQGAYAPAAVRIMQLGAAMTVLLLGVALAGFWARERMRKK